MWSKRPAVFVCTICGKPLSAIEVKLKVAAHFPCVVATAYPYGAVDEVK